MRLASILLAIVSFAACTGYASSKPGYSWAELSDGIEYAKLMHTRRVGDTDRVTKIHAFRIDPKKVRMDVITSPTKESRGESIKRMARRSGAMVATNGGFFTPENKSIGLLIKSGRPINPMHNTSWWSVFAIRGTTPIILPPWKVRNVRSYRMAIQAGPRLVVDGRIPKLKKGNPHARTAIGITRRNKVILLVTEGSGITMQDLAEKMRRNRFKDGLDCPHAMALDGGGSTQLYAKVGKLDLFVNGLSTIPNGIGVFKK